ncbi:MraY family glycosyltransferase [Helicobacter pametensis]|uniref:MraY family glycosyltransferase n=1 Tax=Helicobacter pametensis TaxID=95149 RepID=UPI000489758F|nr:MraY family glycosyltransferase [Helicobacter pametensis]
MGIFVSSFLFSLVLNFCVIFLARKFRFFIDSEASDKPQRFHTLPTPRAGGIGIFAPFFFALLLLFFHHPSPLILGFVIGGSVIFVSGVIEDFNASLSPRLRLLLQCMGAGLFVWLSQCYLSDLGFGISLPSYIGIPFSIFAIVGIINAINIIDGFNGLASGVALLALGCIYAILPSSSMSFVILVLMASILGFFILNFPWGKIFLGDGGAYFLGFVLAGILIYATQDPYGGKGEISPWFGIALLIYPFWEVIFSIYRKKIVRGRSPFKPDRFHLHMLTFRHITHKNPLTSIIIFLVVSPFMLVASFFKTNDLLLLLVSIVFIACYLSIYYWLINFSRKRSKT